MAHLCKDVGSSWSHFVWPKLMKVSDFWLLGGIRNFQESDLAGLTPFYQSVFYSYAYVNNLFYLSVKDKDTLPHNVWQSNLFPQVEWDWCNAGFRTLADLPVVEGQIQVNHVVQSLQGSKALSGVYLKCCAIQKFFGPNMHIGAEATHLIHPLLEKSAKDSQKHTTPTVIG